MWCRDEFLFSRLPKGNGNLVSGCKKRTRDSVTYSPGVDIESLTYRMKRGKVSEVRSVCSKQIKVVCRFESNRLSGSVNDTKNGPYKRELWKRID